MNRKGLVFFTLLSLAVFQLFSQSSYTDNTSYNKKPEISSPNAASITKFVDFPAANYTGVPDISIPFYEINAKAIKIPIGISYHAGGIKVDEVSSNIGLGWSLQAGGVISIMTNRILDEESGYPLIDSINKLKIKNLSHVSSYSGGLISCETASFYQDPYPFGPDPYGLYTGTDISFLSSVIRDMEDSEPDIYTFNFLGRGGKFFADNTGVFRTIPYSELKIERIVESSLPAGYKITDENGNMYEFKIKEESLQESNNSCGSPFVVTEAKSRSYYLNKITTINGEVISFYYTQSLYNYALQKNFSRAVTPTTSDCWQFNNSGSYRFNCETSNSYEIGGQQIDSIKYSNTLVKFLYATSNRTDVSGISKALEKVEIFDLPERNLIKDYQLKHSYLGDRLKLDSVIESQSLNTVFRYNNTMPTRLSYSQDHFGYYNGQNNTTLLPDDEYHDFYNGADRRVDTNYQQAGILKEIIHPTGGRTEYIYESNDFWIPDTTIIYPKTIAMNRVSYPDQTVSDTFSIPSNVTRVKIFHTNSYDGTQIHNDYCYINLYGPNSYFRRFLGDALYPGIDIDLDPGLYTLEIENVGSTYSAEATIAYFTETNLPPHTELGGGLRIKRINKYTDSSQVSFSKYFEYKQSQSANSSGLTSYYPGYIEYKDEVIHKQDGTAYSACSSVYCGFISQSSSAIQPLGFGNGSNVLYNEVASYITNKNESGYERTRYIVNSSEFSSYPSFPYPPRITYDWVNGKVLDQSIYERRNGQFNLIRKTTNTYNYDAFNKDDTSHYKFDVYGLKVAEQNSPFICFSSCPNVVGTYISDISFGLQRYQLYSSFHYLSKTEDTLHGQSSGDYVTTSTSYYYDNPFSTQISRIKTTSSKGDSLIQHIRYPRDFSSYGFIADMISKNVLSSPIENYTVKKTGSSEHVLGGKIFNYKSASTFLEKVYNYETASPVLLSSYTPSVISNLGVFTKDNLYNENMAINGYDAVGNVRQLQKVSDVLSTYIWDYNNQYPVAEVINADSSSVAYTSFESDGKGDWSYSGLVNSSYKLTGDKSYLLSGGSITKSGLTSGVYIVSYWGQGSVLVNGSGPTRTGKTIGNWTYYEHELTTTGVTVSGSTYIDELRLYPKGAMMKTYTYKPLVGITSQCDATNRILYYYYDGFNRLQTIRDEDGKVVKHVDYQYQTNNNQ